MSRLDCLSQPLRRQPPLYTHKKHSRPLCSERWPPRTDAVAYYLGEDRTLTVQLPLDAKGFDTYQVESSAGTGDQSRWHTLVGRPIVNPYPDRKSKDQELLVYTSAPLDEDREVTGHPIVTLYVSSTDTDGTFFAYLEDVHESGRVTYVTEGLLRALHRELSTERSPYTDVVPYRTFARRDGEPLVPGRVATLVFELLPTSYLFKKGHRIRLALAGADKDHFALLPEAQPTVTYHRTRRFPWRVDLPVVPRPAS